MDAPGEVSSLTTSPSQATQDHSKLSVAEDPATAPRPGGRPPMGIEVDEQANGGEQPSSGHAVTDTTHIAEGALLQPAPARLIDSDPEKKVTAVVETEPSSSVALADGLAVSPPPIPYGTVVSSVAPTPARALSFATSVASPSASTPGSKAALSQEDHSVPDDATTNGEVIRNQQLDHVTPQRTLPGRQTMPTSPPAALVADKNLLNRARQRRQDRQRRLATMKEEVAAWDADIVQVEGQLLADAAQVATHLRQLQQPLNGTPLRSTAEMEERFPFDSPAPSPTTSDGSALDASPTMAAIESGEVAGLQLRRHLQPALQDLRVLARRQRVERLTAETRGDPSSGPAEETLSIVGQERKLRRLEREVSDKKSRVALVKRRLEAQRAGDRTYEAKLEDLKAANADLLHAEEQLEAAKSRLAEARAATDGVHEQLRNLDASIPHAQASRDERRAALQGRRTAVVEDSESTGRRLIEDEVAAFWATRAKEIGSVHREADEEAKKSAGPRLEAAEAAIPQLRGEYDTKQADVMAVLRRADAAQAEVSQLQAQVTAENPGILAELNKSPHEGMGEEEDDDAGPLQREAQIDVLQNELVALHTELRSRPPTHRMDDYETLDEADSEAVLRLGGPEVVQSMRMMSRLEAQVVAIAAELSRTRQEQEHFEQYGAIEGFHRLEDELEVMHREVAAMRHDMTGFQEQLHDHQANAVPVMAQERQEYASRQRDLERDAAALRQEAESLEAEADLVDEGDDTDTMSSARMQAVRRQRLEAELQDFEAEAAQRAHMGPLERLAWRRNGQLSGDVMSRNRSGAVSPGLGEDCDEDGPSTLDQTVVIVEEFESTSPTRGRGGDEGARRTRFRERTMHVATPAPDALHVTPLEEHSPRRQFGFTTTWFMRSIFRNYLAPSFRELERLWARRQARNPSGTGHTKIDLDAI